MRYFHYVELNYVGALFFVSHYGNRVIIEVGRSVFYVRRAFVVMITSLLTRNLNLKIVSESLTGLEPTSLDR
jgi:hypothetical protein